LDTDLEALTHAQAAGKAKMIRVGAALVGAVVVLGGALAIFGGSSEELSPEGSETIQKSAAAAEQVAKKPPAPSPAPPPVAEEPKKAPEPSPEEKLAAMFRVENPAEAESCETILGKTPEQFASEPGWRAAHNWKLARKNLVAGNNEVAVELMCKAAFIDPRGSAVSGLVRFHLGNRALTRALALAERGVEVSNGKNRVARELMGDVYNQMGELEKARNIWLETMNLSVDDTDRLKAVVRNLAKQATKARRGGDYPLAERLLRRAASFEQDDAEVAASLAFVLQKNDQPALAKIWADHALELDSASKEAKSVLEQL
jgi:tetratricopeptide (TPR) repeat protein